MTLDELLLTMGLNITSSAIYDFIKAFRRNEPKPTLEGCKKALQSYLAIENAQIFSEKIIEFLAINGNIDISGADVFAKEAISLKSSKSTEFQIKNGSTTRTDQTSINVGSDAEIRGSGGAAIKQSEQGITFSV